MWEIQDEDGGEDGEEGRDKTKWERVVELVQTDFRDGVLAEEETWKAVVIILKGGGEYLSICLMEVVWKVVEVILNYRFTTFITYHNSLHGLWAGRGTGTTTLKIKLLQGVTEMSEAVLHRIFMDLHKA